MTAFPGGRLLLATRNPGKIRELGAVLGDLDLDLLSLADIATLDEVEEDGHTFAENALIKARAASRATGLATTADDSGLCVDALGGGPGVRSARFAGPGASDEDNNRLLVERLAGVPDADRGARYVCAAALVLPGGRETVVEGEVEGRILRTPRGRGGFGYDPYFYYEPFGQTFAETPAEAKNAVSHRGVAFRALAAVIRERLRDPS